MNTQSKIRQLSRIRRLTRLMDTAFKIPGLGLKVGLDPIVGLIPGIGDLVTAATSAYIIFLATQFDLPKGKLGKMIFNIGLEFLVGTVPLLGDVFDAFFKSNVRNLALLEQHLAMTSPDLQRQDRYNLHSAADNVSLGQIPG
ncbi:MAG: DUF4112 domain-containing protein [Leptolyngbyaceae cyanobacterium]